MTQPRCNWCGHWFERKNKRQIFCSVACGRKDEQARRRKAYREERDSRPREPLTCAHCERNFLPDPNKSGRKVHCSEWCREDARRDYFRRWKQERAKRVEMTQPVRRYIPVTARLCSSCSNWGPKGCRLEMARTCNPGVMSRYWEKREAVSA